MTQKEPVSKKEYEELENKIKKLRKNLALEIEINDRYRKALEEIEAAIATYSRTHQYSIANDLYNQILDISNNAKGEKKCID